VVPPVDSLTASVLVPMLAELCPIARVLSRIAAAVEQPAAPMRAVSITIARIVVDIVISSGRAHRPRTA
jgi:hypothetical protein